MRRPAIHAARAIALLILLAVLALPTGAFAADGAPDEMVDPVGAMEPEIGVGTPAGADDQGATPDAAAIPDVQAAASPEPTSAAAPQVSAPAGAATYASGSLPFTGPEPGLLVLLVLVGLVAVLGGITALGYARVAAEAH